MHVRDGLVEVVSGLDGRHDVRVTLEVIMSSNPKCSSAMSKEGFWQQKKLKAGQIIAWCT